MISLIIVANNAWGDYADDYIESVIRNESSTEIILVDNGSPSPYPESDLYKLVRLESEENYNYMKALNLGAKEADGDWLMFSNDDVLCNGAFSNKIHGLSKNCLYGMEIRRKLAKWGTGKDFLYIYGWLMIMHKSVFKKVGKFDEYYLHAGFDDIDYSWRAQSKGIELRKIDLPFIHLADQPDGFHRRTAVDNYTENMLRSKKHFLKKARGLL